MNNQFSITKLNSIDLEDYKIIRKLSVVEQPLAFSASPEEVNQYSDNGWLSELMVHKTILGIKEDNKLVGIIEIAFNPRLKVDHIVNIYNFYVNPDYRGNGLGKMLIKAAINEVKTYPNIEKIQLQVTAKQEKAIRIYKELGFIEIGKSIRALKHNGEYTDIITMELGTSD